MALRSSLLSLALLSLSACSTTSGGQPAKAPEAPKPSAAATAAPVDCKAFLDTICEGPRNASLCEEAQRVTKLMSAEACKVASRDIAYTQQQLSVAAGSCDQLTTRLCAHFGKDSELCELVTTQTQRFDADRCDAMLEHYDAVVADLEKMQERLQPLPPEKFAKLFEGDVPAFGPPTAKVRIVMFSDFQCPFCQRATDTVKAIQEKYGDKVRFVFRQFPLPFHQHAKDAARAALFAHSKGKFWEMHDKLFANQQQLERADLERYATELGLDGAALDKALEGDGFEAQVNADIELGSLAAVEGTPSLFIDGKRVSNAIDVDAVLQLIAKELETQP